MFLEMKMPFTEALMVSLIGLVTVVVILAVIAVLIIMISKAIRGLEASLSKKSKAAPAAAAPVPAGTPMPAGMMQGDVELIDTDEKTAAVIMAIVSDKSGIPLNRLSFKSIRLMEDNK